MRLIVIAVVLLWATLANATQVYFISGLGGRAFDSELRKTEQLARKQGAKTSFYSHWGWWFAVQDAVSRKERIVCVGQSRGGDMCVAFAAVLKAKGKTSVVITLDPTHLVGSAPKGVRVVNFHRPGAAVGGGRISGAENIEVKGARHLDVPVLVRSRVLQLIR